MNESQPPPTVAAPAPRESGDLAWRQVEEQLLVLRCQARQESAFPELLQRYERRVLYYLHRLIPDLEQALEVSQDVWLAVYQKIDSLRAPEAFRVWLFRLAHHQASTALRRGHRREEIYEELAAEDGAGNDSGDEVLHFDDAALVHRVLGEISVRHREVLTLRFLEDLSLSEIAEVVGCGLATAKTRLHYAKKAFRQRFEAIHSAPPTPANVCPR